MVKIRNNFHKKQTAGKPINKSKTKKAHVPDDIDMDIKEAAEAESNDYDSMIENGTSDDSAEDEQESEDGDDSDASDDGFSEHEADVKKEPTNSKQPKTLKRKQAELPAAVNETAKKPKDFEKIKPPTLEEINELKETRNLFHSNLFRLQVKEMLAELKVKDKYKKYINTWLEQFKSFVKQLKSQTEKQDIDKMQWLQECELKVPNTLTHLRLQNKKTFQFQFIKPTSEPYLLGAAATETLLGPKLFADVCLPMPAECFQKDNYLNLIYEQKRNYYLTYIANEMLKSKQFAGLSVAQLKFNYHNNNPLKPVLEITPPDNAGSMASKLCVRLFIAAEEQSFKLSRFVPWNNNVRACMFGDDDNDDALQFATPNYNAGVLFDLTMQRNQQLLQAVFGAQKNLQEGLVLLKVWLRQRQLNVGFSGFHAHLLALFMAHLSKQRKLHANMSSYQVARTVWIQLSHSAWDENGKGIGLCTTNATNQPTLEQWHAYYDIVFIDATGFYNVCANLSLEIYRRVRTEAKLAVDMLNDMKLNSFQSIFMTKFPIYTQFDHVLKINKADAIDQLLTMHVPPADKYNYAGYAYPQLLKVVTNLLRKGLGQRVHTLMPIEQTQMGWSCEESAPACVEHLHLGIVLNPEYAFEVLDKGPEAIAEHAEEFRKFWGDKAQLRRFQDGSITESVVWAAATDALSKKRHIVRDIVLHLLQQHFQLDAKDVAYIANEFDVVNKLTPCFKTDKLYEKYKVAQDIDAEAASLPVIRCFDDLARKLHALNELPLEIVSIAGISPIFRYCEPTPVLPQARCIGTQFYATHVERGVLQLSTSGKWPNELGALRALKTAFYLQIAKLLNEKHHLRCKVTYNGILVLKQGYCFAIEIAHPKEIALLKQQKNERGITQYVDSVASIALEKRHYILPKVSGALHALYQLQPCFGASVMMAKRWLHTQLIDDGLWPDECTELLIATQFSGTCAQHNTNVPQTGFIRFLQLLAYTDWRTQLVLLNFNNALDEKEVGDLEQRFNSERDQFPPLCIVTAYDQKHYGQLWSNASRPNVHVLARVTLLARQALAIIEPTLLSSTAAFVKPSRLFTASNQGYDLVIQLKPDMVPNTLAYEFGSPFAAFGKPNWRLPLADTDFLNAAVSKLREAYGDFAVFFYNPSGGKEIGVIWKPNLDIEKPFKISDVNGCTLNAAGTAIQCQKDVLIEDFKIILKDFYVRMDTVEAVLQATQATVNTAASNKQTQRYFNSAAKIVETVAMEMTTAEPEAAREKPHKLNKKLKPTKQPKVAAKKTQKLAKKKQQLKKRAPTK